MGRLLPMNTNELLFSNATAQPSGASALLLGFGLMASLIVAIGAQNAFVLRQGLRREHVGVIVLLCIVIDVMLTAIGVLGLARLAEPHPMLLKGLVVFGALFLLVYGWSAARRAWSSTALTLEAELAVRSPWGVVVAQTLAISLLNPHVYLDTVMLVGAVGAQQPPHGRWAFLVGAGSASAVWFCLLGYGARWLAPLFAKPAAWRWLDGVVAVTMWTLGALLLWGLLMGGAAVAALSGGLLGEPIWR
jgi:L-lysine exporter family protein LysE/ArgO